MEASRFSEYDRFVKLPLRRFSMSQLNEEPGMRVGLRFAQLYADSESYGRVSFGRGFAEVSSCVSWVISCSIRPVL